MAKHEAEPRLTREEALELVIKRMSADPQTAYQMLSVAYAKNELKRLKDELQKVQEHRQAVKAFEAERDKDKPISLFRLAYTEDSENNG